MSALSGTHASPILTSARARHVPGIAELIGGQAALGRMLPRSSEELLASLSSFLVAEGPSGRILAAGGLRVYETGNAEIIGLVVHEDCRSAGLGRRITDALSARARHRGVPRLFALTLEPAFFRRLGFREVSLASVPEKVRRDCRTCPFRSRCRETAVALDLDHRVTGGEQRPAG